MIISKTPCRISLVGGGSDLPDFYLKYGGAVLSTSIDKYIYVAVNPKFDHHIRLSYSQTEEVDTISEIRHPILREVLKMLNVTGIELTSIADIPSQGTGLGSSSSFTVGVLNTLFAYAGRHASPETLAELSARIEIECCRQPIGKQDHYAAAFGGLNLITFNSHESVTVSPIVCAPRTIQQLQENMLLFYTGITRSASEILGKQKAALNDGAAAVETTKSMARLATELAHELRRDNLDAVGEVLHESWLLKRSIVDGVSNDSIDQWYERARKAGARGGKILGAGGGGFLLLYASCDRHAAIERAIGELRRIPFSFDRDGSRIIFYNPDRAKGALNNAALVA
jgi:D-glycero-alpha-D-manno-heptose-7-phosphate kinase